MQNFTRKDAGDQAEHAALRHLQQAGLQMIARNYRCRGGELDLVMQDGKTLVFVEVRYRSSQRFGGAAASVDYTKQRRLVLAAQHFLQTHQEYRRHAARFDVITLTRDADQAPLQWLKDAFRASP